MVYSACLGYAPAVRLRQESATTLTASGIQADAFHTDTIPLNINLLNHVGEYLQAVNGIVLAPPPTERVGSQAQLVTNEPAGLINNTVVPLRLMVQLFILQALLNIDSVTQPITLCLHPLYLEKTQFMIKVMCCVFWQATHFYQIIIYSLVQKCILVRG